MNLKQGLLDDAAAIFLRVLKRDPGNGGARDGLEEALGGRGRKRAAAVKE